MKKLIMAIVCLMTMVAFTSCINGNAFASNVNETSSEEETSESVCPTEKWVYEENIDEMNDTKTYHAHLVSENYVEQDLPYSKTNALIGIRHTKKYGNEVMLFIGSGQIHGSEYDNSNYVEVRFDNNPSKKYYFGESESGSYDIIFLHNAKDFISNCKKANNIKIKIPIFQEGRELFTFHSDNLLAWSH